MIEQALQPFRRRLQTLLTVQAAGRGWLWGLVLVTLLGLLRLLGPSVLGLDMDRQILGGRLNVLAFFTPILLAVLAAFWRASRPLPLETVVSVVEQRAQLGAGLQTALESQSQQHRFAPLLETQVLKALGQQQPQAVLPMPRPKRWGRVLGLLVMALVFWQLPAPVFGSRGPIVSSQRIGEIRTDALREQATKLRKLASRDETLRSLARDGQELADDLKRGQLPVTEAFDRVAQLEESIRKTEAERRAVDRLRNALDKNPGLTDWSEPDADTNADIDKLEKMARGHESLSSALKNARLESFNKPLSKSQKRRLSFAKTELERALRDVPKQSPEQRQALKKLRQELAKTRNRLAGRPEQSGAESDSEDSDESELDPDSSKDAQGSSIQADDLADSAPPVTDSKQSQAERQQRAHELAQRLLEQGFDNEADGQEPRPFKDLSRKEKDQRVQDLALGLMDQGLDSRKAGETKEQWQQRLESANLDSDSSKDSKALQNMAPESSMAEASDEQRQAKAQELAKSLMDQGLAPKPSDSSKQQAAEDALARTLKEQGLDSRKPGESKKDWAERAQEALEKGPSEASPEANEPSSEPKAPDSDSGSKTDPKTHPKGADKDDKSPKNDPKQDKAGAPKNAKTDPESDKGSSEDGGLLQDMAMDAMGSMAKKMLEMGLTPSPDMLPQDMPKEGGAVQKWAMDMAEKMLESGFEFPKDFEPPDLPDLPDKADAMQNPEMKKWQERMAKKLMESQPKLSQKMMKKAKEWADRNSDKLQDQAQRNGAQGKGSSNARGSSEMSSPLTKQLSQQFAENLKKAGFQAPKGAGRARQGRPQRGENGGGSKSKTNQRGTNASRKAAENFRKATGVTQYNPEMSRVEGKNGRQQWVVQGQGQSTHGQGSSTGQARPKRQRAAKRAQTLGGAQLDRAIRRQRLPNSYRAHVKRYFERIQAQSQSLTTKKESK